MFKKKKEELERLVKFACNDMLIMQVYGIVEFEIIDKIIPLGLQYKINDNDGFELFVEEMGKEISYDSPLVLHLHNEDLLYFILNYKEFTKKTMEKINRYIKYLEER